MKLDLTFSALLCSLAISGAAPVAVNDSYTTDEDVPLNGGTTVTSLLSTNFEPSQTDNLAAGPWQYLDKIKNSLNGQTADDYPADAEAANWKDLAFNTATSTIAGWQTASLPIQGGGVDGMPGAPNLLTGISTGGGNYSVTTYLFRHTFTATAAQAAIAQWTLHALVDDGAIFYLNGQEIGRLGMDSGQLQPPGTITTQTATDANPSETTYEDIAVTLTGKLVAGNNVLAVELHQTYGGGNQNSSDAGIDVTLTPGTSSVLGGLAYADNVDGTNRASSADGDLDTGTGNPGSSVNVVITRGNFGGSGTNVSGGWRRTLTLPSAGTVHVKCDARARTTDLEDTEYAEAIVLVDGTRYAPPGRNYLVRQVGNAGAADTGWATYELDIPLTAGNHIFTFGGFGPRPSNGDENGTVNFDNISVSMAAGGGSLLANDTGGATTAVLDTGTSHGTLALNADGTFLYTPAANYNGPDSFTYHATDGTSPSNIATVALTVTSVNDAPVGIADGPYTTTEDTPLTVPAATGVLANDTDVENQALTATIVAPSTNGTVALNANGGFTFTPAANFAGQTTFTYRATDGSAQSAITTVTVNVTDVPDAPVTAADTYTAVKNTPLVVTATVPGTITDEVLPYKSAGWHYFDSLVLANRNLGTTWRTAAFVENADWKIGPAELGYGDGDEGTQIADNTDPAFNQNATDKFIGYY
ncbi:MAG TPA: cadherin-like domain-containing protein, partial [Verrucomicrobiales bacterium]|nr:cadherin-like domain-containing protein [Verrucomicrobiales bacterium]